MASPPYSQPYANSISPPYPSHSQLPQPPKRRVSDMLPNTSNPSTKRRKGSILSTTSSSHPLRQTSFPPELTINANSPSYSRSPSMDTMSISGSVAGNNGTSNKRKRSRKSKGGNEKDDTSSQRGKSAIPGETNGRLKTEVEEEPEDEDFGDDTNFAAASTYAEENAREKERVAILTKNFDAEQWERFTAWRSSKLADAVVRRIINQTLSQSAPPAVILAVKSAAKIYAGNLIENARKVQTQWLAAGTDPNQPPPLHPTPNHLPTPSSSIIPHQNPTLQTPEPEPSSSSETNGTVEIKKEEEKKAEEKRRGPLLPDHLREAHRRHLKEGDGGLVGQLGLWQQSLGSGTEVSRFGGRNGGRRIFK